MGWWSLKIMGGDSPLDFKSSIYDSLGLDQFEAKPHQTQKAFNELSEDKLNQIIPDIVSEWGCGNPGEDFHTEETSIGFQVLAFLMMESGANIPPSTRQLMEEWIVKDPWSSDDEERKEVIDDHLTKLRNYNGTPPALETGEGLLEQAFKAFTQKNPS